MFSGKTIFHLGATHTQSTRLKVNMTLDSKTPSATVVWSEAPGTLQFLVIAAAEMA